MLTVHWKQTTFQKLKSWAKKDFSEKNKPTSKGIQLGTSTNICSFLSITKWLKRWAGDWNTENVASFKAKEVPLMKSPWYKGMVFITMTWGGDKTGMCWSSVSSTQHFPLQRSRMCSWNATGWAPVFWTTHQRRLKALKENLLLYVQCSDATVANPRQAWKSLPTSLLKTRTLNKGNTIAQGKDLHQGQWTIEIKAGRMNPLTKTQQSRNNFYVNLLISFIPSHIIWLLSKVNYSSL